MLSWALEIQHGTILSACVYQKTDVPVTLISLPTCGFLFEGPVPEIFDWVGFGLTAGALVRAIPEVRGNLHPLSYCCPV